MKKHFTLKRILTYLLVILVLIQFIRIDKTNPAAEPAMDFLYVENVPDEIGSTLKHSCYDCHSNNTTYPWYSNIAPVSFWLKGHINNARKHLNFSEWGTYTEDRKAHKIEECIEFVGEKWMPIASYTWMHSEAKLSDEERKELVDWFMAQQ